MEQQGAVGELDGALRVMGDDDERAAALAQLRELVGQAVGGDLVEAGEGLVEQQEVGVVDEAAGDRDTLRGAAGHGVDTADPPPPRGRARRAARPARRGIGRRPWRRAAKARFSRARELAVEQGRVADVADRGRAAISRERIRSRPLIVDRDGLEASGRGLREAGEDAEPGALARAVRAEDGDGFAGRDLEIDARQRPHPAESLLDARAREAESTQAPASRRPGQAPRRSSHRSARPGPAARRSSDRSGRRSWRPWSRAREPASPGSWRSPSPLRSRRSARSLPPARRAGARWPGLGARRASPCSRLPSSLPVSKSCSRSAIAT